MLETPKPYTSVSEFTRFAEFGNGCLTMIGFFVAVIVEVRTDWDILG